MIKVVPFAAKPKRPPIANIRHGDLLFPKEDGAWVPYEYDPTGARNYANDKQKWTAERDKKVAKLDSKPNATDYERHLAETLRVMDYGTFLALYTRGGAAPYGLLGFSVGHVAIVLEDEVHKFHLVEAVSHGKWNQVRVIPIDDQDSPYVKSGNVVFHARFRNYDDIYQRGLIHKFVDVALGQEGVQYDFWNFDLCDKGGFYCSKLVWFAARNGMSLVLDDDPDCERLFWYSPKQLLNSGHLVCIFAPGRY